MLPPPKCEGAFRPDGRGTEGCIVSGHHNRSFLVDGAERTMLTILRRSLWDYCRQSIEQISPPGAQGRGRQHRIAQAELHGSDETADQPTRASSSGVA